MPLIDNASAEGATVRDGTPVGPGRPKASAVLALDIGGTKLEAAVVEPSGHIVSVERRTTEVDRGPDDVIERLVDLGRAVAASAGVEMRDIPIVGVASPGPLDPETGVVLGPPNMPGWTEVPLAERLASSLGVPVRIDNDANSTALAEARFGAGRGIDRFVYVTVSTGIGAGLVLDGRLYRGENGNAGEIGHVSLAFYGRPCRCGRRGCLETYASGTSIAERARERIAGGFWTGGTRTPPSSGAVTAQWVFEGARQNDPPARRLWDETMTILGTGVANVINSFNPRRVIIGGGVASAGELLFEPVRRVALEQVLPALATVVDIVPSELGPHTGVLGAAALALEGLEPAPADMLPAGAPA